MFTILITNNRSKTKECVSLFLSKKEAKLEMQLLAADIISDLSEKESHIFSLINESGLKIFTKQKTVGWLSNTVSDICLFTIDIVPFRKTSTITGHSVETQTLTENICESDKYTQTEINDRSQSSINQSQSLVFIDELRAKLDRQ